MHHLDKRLNQRTRILAISALLCVVVIVGLLAFNRSVALGESHVQYPKLGAKVNQATGYPVKVYPSTLKCTVNVNDEIGAINPRIFGTNLEWFNDAGGLASSDESLKNKLVNLTKQQGVTVMRFPGGTLADFYHWKNGIGDLKSRPKIKHPTDSGSSANNFGSPEFFNFLKDTQSEGLITVNAGTATAKEASEWVAYANQPNNPQRIKDGIQKSANIKLWEIGNELYLPGNPGEKIITVSPEEYAKRYLAFSRAIKAVDPTVTTIAIGTAKSHIGPDTQYQNWTKVLLEKAASEIDMIAVHNAYFPMLYVERQPPVADVYSALLASPEAVDRSLKDLERLISQYETKKKIGIAVTEWGALFSLPNVDNFWVDHVKTMGSGIYIARMLQVFISHPRIELANYFKLTDRSFMGWINYEGQPKVPYWVFALYANYTGDARIAAKIESPDYATKPIGIMMPEKGVKAVTVVASKNSRTGDIYVNLVNRSLTTAYPIDIDFQHLSAQSEAKILRIQTNELTAHNGRDIPPEWPYDKAYEPYSTAPENSIQIKESTWDMQAPIQIAPFSVITIVLNAKTQSKTSHAVGVNVSHLDSHMFNKNNSK